MSVIQATMGLDRLIGLGDTVSMRNRNMHMIKSLTKHGDDYALVIEKPILESLRATPETPFEVFTDGRRLVLVPLGNANEEKRFHDAVAMVHKRFGKAMKKLVK